MPTRAVATVKTATSRSITVGSGAQVRFGNGTIRTFTITNRPQSVAPDKGIISDQSPLGAALLGKTAGEAVTYAVGARKLSVEVVAVLPVR
ncbi:MAG: hypothetical protein A3H73_02065 [Candidatus Taylorbacteria bacterium RIFCSPLOWO2_02_FULL_50_120]|nr:MAG: hypothetical protein A3H73_02065 [Candidatus Taylorbacteria bacterium RIFCSPLOWO2_02_FULL_50_120]